MAPAPCTQLQLVVHVDAIVLFQLSACSGAKPCEVLARLHQYSAVDWSVAMQSSPLLLSADWIGVQDAPPVVERKVWGPLGLVS
jgi:hypothetical protein